jgi:hypothetical protein
MDTEYANSCTNKLSQLKETEARMDGQMMTTDCCTQKKIKSCNLMLTPGKLSGRHKQIINDL